MKNLGRREFLGGAATVAAATALPGLASAAETVAPTGAKRPRAIIHLLMRGGFDAVYTTDPKRKSEVLPRIDVPYEEGEIFQIGGRSFGPLWKPLAHLAPRMAIVNGVVGGTVAHQTGEENTIEMRRVFPVPSSTPAARDTGRGLVGILGMLRESRTGITDLRFNTPYKQPAGRSLVALREEMPRDKLADGTLVARLSQLARDKPRRDVLQRVLERQLGECRANQKPGCDSFDATRALFAHMPEEALPPPAKLKGPRAGTEEALELWSTIIRDSVFMLRHRLTTGIFVYPPFSEWDSHVMNKEVQGECMGVFAPALAHLVAELDRTRTIDDTPLSDEVAIVFSSEMGRFPIVNEQGGKDHFPEYPVVMMGPGIRPGTYGQTDKQMVATPISTQTGRPSSSAKDIVPTIDDVGATILHWFGIDDTRSIGYIGRRLDFLLG